MVINIGIKMLFLHQLFNKLNQHHLLMLLKETLVLKILTSKLLEDFEPEKKITSTI
jgi:hypothetical protein